MMWLIKFLQKRPTDKTIRTIRIVFWLVLIISTYYSFIYTWNGEIQDALFWQDLWESWKNIVTYIIVSLWFFPLFMWITNICLLKSIYIRIAQIVFSIVLFYMASITEPSADLWIDTLMWLMAIIPLVWWITWKFITKSCLRYWEKITKIRV